MSILDQSPRLHAAVTRYAPYQRARGLVAYLELWRQRRALADLDAHQLRDIGLTQEAADREAARPIWDVPEYWRR